MGLFDISVKSPFHTQACLQVGKRTWDTPKHEEEVGRGPHEIRMFGRIVGAQSAEQSVILLLTPKPYINNRKSTITHKMEEGKKSNRCMVNDKMKKKF